MTSLSSCCVLTWWSQLVISTQLSGSISTLCHRFERSSTDVRRNRHYIEYTNECSFPSAPPISAQWHKYSSHYTFPLTQWPSRQQDQHYPILEPARRPQGARNDSVIRRMTSSLELTYYAEDQACQHSQPWSISRGTRSSANPSVISASIRCGPIIAPGTFESTTVRGRTFKNVVDECYAGFAFERAVSVQLDLRHFHLLFRNDYTYFGTTLLHHFPCPGQPMIATTPVRRGLPHYR
jgi:hypothetical protein